MSEVTRKEACDILCDGDLEPNFQTRLAIVELIERQDRLIRAQEKRIAELVEEMATVVAIFETPATPSQIPDDRTGEQEREAQARARFTEYFVKNYPGPDTIIHKPEWHAGRIFRAALDALKAPR